MQGIAVDETMVYWMADGVLRKVPLAGGPPTMLAQGEYTRAGPRIDGRYAYWTTRGYDANEKRITNTGELRRVSIDGGPVETLLGGRNPGSDLAAANGIAYFVDEQPGGSTLVSSAGGGTPLTPAQSFVLRGDTLAFLDQSGLWSIRTDGSERTALVPKPPVVVVHGPLAWSDLGIFYWRTRIANGSETKNGPTELSLHDAHGGDRILQSWEHMNVAAIAASGATVYMVARASYGGGCILDSPPASDLLLAFDPETRVTRTLANRDRPGGSFYTDPPVIAPFPAFDPSYVYWLHDRTSGPSSLMRTPK
ncbi:MAG: hypothetical protein JWM74_4210 [Myxococcaceae bacterium]|nr:hypothetical protein [Myxococcaceae bacterium]